MIPKTEIKKNRVLCLSWKSNSKVKSCKRGYVFQKGLFLVAIAKQTKILKSIQKSKKIAVKINGSEQTCRPKVVDKFDATKALMKKEMELLMRKKMSPNSKFAQKLDEIAARHVVVELKPIKR